MTIDEFVAKWGENDMAQWRLDDEVLSQYEAMASNLNNDGMEKQLGFLVDCEVDLEALDRALDAEEGRAESDFLDEMNGDDEEG